ncbi:hypothetical protein LCGC14_1079210 [marine sediment metagenome]|uniref:Uncharacterized protein n=1 Tax=marine sediment metagenome TaxID=412755 RepID=A0A0F9MFY9_9ZZZZ
MRLFDMPIATAPRWKFWLVRIFGKTIHEEAGFTFKCWRGKIWVFGKGGK